MNKTVVTLHLHRYQLENSFEVLLRVHFGDIGDSPPKYCEYKKSREHEKNNQRKLCTLTDHMPITFENFSINNVTDKEEYFSAVISAANFGQLLYLNRGLLLSHHYHLQRYNIEITRLESKNIFLFINNILELLVNVSKIGPSENQFKMEGLE
jgi:hypothetical protein